MGYLFKKKQKSVWYDNRRRRYLLGDPVALEEVLLS
jgi:hypothetical protein